MDETAKPMSIPKGILITLIVIAVVALIVVVCTLVNIPMWPLFLGLCTWMATGAEMSYKGVTKIWLGAIIGLGIGFLLQLGELWSLIAAAVLVLVMIFCMVTNKLSIAFNISTGIFTTVATIGFVVVPAAFISCAAGYLVIGILPVLVVGALAKKKAKGENEKAVASE